MADKASVLARIDAARALAASIGVSAPPPGRSIVVLGLLFGGVGFLPFAFGQTFARGHVPAGSSVVANCAEFQCVPWSYHDDGSVRDAHIAGYCNVASPGRVDVAMSLGQVVGRNFMRLGAPDVQVSINGRRLAATPQVIAAGPVMLHEKWTASFDAQVRVVYETRTFAHGHTEVFVPCVENAGFKATVQTNRVLALMVIIGGATTFAETVDVKHHTRVALMRGATWSYWIGQDPRVLPAHDGAYLCATESLPPYVAKPATLPALATSYAPNYVGEGGPDMDATGYSPRIGILARSNLYYLTTGGRKAFDYMMAEALSAGSWSVHYREESTQAVPLFSANPAVTWLGGTLPKGSGAANHPAVVNPSHQPSSVYVAAKVTGWRWFIDEHLDWCAHNHFYQQAVIRQNEKGILRTDVGANQDRGAGWALRTLAQALALAPSTHPLLPDLVFAWQQNMAYYRGRYVDGTIDGGRYVNNLGVIAPYSSWTTSLYTGADRANSVAWWGSGWMQAIVAQSIGHALQMRLPIGAKAQDDTRAVFLQCAKLIVGLCGDGRSSWNWRRLGVYAMPFGKSGAAQLPSAANPWYATLGEAYVEYIKAKGLSALDPAPGGTLKRHSVETDVVAGDWSTGFLSYPWPSLVYAVMHKAPGADAALARVMSSKSWPLIAASINEPEWAGMMPPGYRHPGAA